jgi:hypothetical protein
MHNNSTGPKIPESIKPLAMHRLWGISGMPRPPDLTPGFTVAWPVVKIPSVVWPVVRIRLSGGHPGVGQRRTTVALALGRGLPLLG